MFSVLMSIYHKESPQHFNECMQSIWDSQILKPDEIILVEDGRLTVALDEVISQWEIKLNTILKIVRLEKNVGLGNALNEGLKYCNYEWVFRMDTDDISIPERFQKQIEFISHHPNVVLFGGQILEFSQNINDNNHNLKSVPIGNFVIRKFAKIRCPFNHMTVAYKKSIILELGGYQHHLLMEDYNLWLRVLATSYHVNNLPDILVYARVGNGMLQRRKGLEYIKSEKQLLDLKLALQIQPLLPAVLLFLIRSTIRLLPSNLLTIIYRKLLRKKID